MQRKHILVIGAGLGGLTAAVRLAKMGFRVSVFEKNESAGGKMNQIRMGAYRFDTGPSILTMRFVFEELFACLNERLEDHLNLIPVSPICRYFFADKTVFDAYQEEDLMHRSISQLDENEYQNYKRYIRYTEKLYHGAGELFLLNPIHELGSLLALKNLPNLINVTRLDAFKSMHQRLTHVFSNPKLIQIFDRYATYNGSNPFQAPATLNMIAYVENAMGVYYISGGMYRLVETLLEMCDKHKVELLFETPVEKIYVKNDRAAGLIVNGDIIPGDYIVCNNDVVTSFQDLIDDYKTRTIKLQKLEPSLSGLVFMWGVKRSHANLAHHNIFFSQDYQAEFKQIFGELRPPDDPTIYVSISSKADKAHAASGSENWFVLLNMPYVTEGQNWSQYVPVLRKIVLNQLKNYGFDIENSIEVENMITPPMFYDLYGSNRGSIYGLSSNSRFSAFMRPANRNRDIEGLYFVGGSTHPGGGIPLVTLSGKMVSDLIAGREGLKPGEQC